MPSKLDYPVVVKGIFYEAYIAQSFEEVLPYFNKLKSKLNFASFLEFSFSEIFSDLETFECLEDFFPMIFLI